MLLAPEPRKKSLVNLTPLIDIVFILLIFFMLASNFVRWHAIEINVGEASEVEIDTSTMSIVDIDANMDYRLNNKAISFENIISTLRAKMKNDPKHLIVIQPQDGVHVQVMIDALNEIKIFAANNVSIAKPAEQGN